ncbi:hypothetical protein [Hymenobacter glacialis]|uniref:hypothetical protein n=1 Tax=Hymenobacter glacialis TaxID=1908236 RepID=UPI000A7CF3F3|nr:hypothetical protein [Hymenobacter glacialis]
MVQLFSIAVRVSLVVFQLAIAVVASGQQLAPVLATTNPFFDREEVVMLTLSLPLEDVLRDRGANPRPHPATLAYRNAHAAPTELAVQVQVRGNRRKDPAVCEFPPLLIKFPPEARAGNIFGEVAELKLTTHCLSDTYTLREYLVYKLYNVATDLSYRTRLCRITYRDSRGRRRVSEQYGFFLENSAAMARRNQATLVAKGIIVGMENMDPVATATLALFQYMVGNTDWSVPYRHNIRVVSRSQETAPVPVAYDFDYSGLVLAPYAVPPVELGISSVRQRLFRGHRFTPETYAAVQDHYNSRRSAFYNVYLACPYLNQEEKTFATRYLDEFYKTLNDPKDFERRIVRVGDRNSKKYTHIRGFD